jgi:hypothetical protein
MSQPVPPSPDIPPASARALCDHVYKDHDAAHTMAVRLHTAGYAVRWELPLTRLNQCDPAGPSGPWVLATVRDPRTGEPIGSLMSDYPPAGTTGYASGTGGMRVASG